MKIEDLTAEDMEVTKWNVLDGLNTKEAVFALLQDAYKTPKDTKYIYHAIAVAMEAIKVYGIKMTTDEEAASLAEDAAAIKSGTPIRYGTKNARESA